MLSARLGCYEGDADPAADRLGAAAPRALQECLGRGFRKPGLGVSHRLAIESMHAVVDMKPQSDEHSAIRQCAGNPQMATVIEAVACAADMTAPPILPAHGGPPRMLSAWLGW
jgi:hypothetical protein